MKKVFDLLVSKLIKNYSDVGSEEVREAYGWLGGIAGLIINSTILILELTVELFLNSIAIMADAIHNLTDAVSSVITIVSLKLSNRPADKKHPFGYGRIEYITALLFSLLIFIVGYEFIRNSIRRIMHPVPVPFNKAAFLLMLAALPLQIFLNLLTRYLGNAINSSALKASAVESFSDILVLSVVILSLLLTRVTSYPLDGYAGILVSIFILHSGFELCKETMGSILGKAPDKKLIHDISKEVLSYPYISGVHDIVVHNYGPGRYMASLHAEVPWDAPIMEIHDVIDLAEKEIGQKLNLYLVIHMDPFKNDNPEILELRKQLTSMVALIPGIQSIHDFKVVGEASAKTLIFDVVIKKSFNKGQQKQLILSQIEEAVKKMSPEFICKVTLDQDYN